MCSEMAAVVVNNGISISSGSASSSRVQHAHIDARLMAHAPIGIARRISLCQRLAQSVQTLAPDSPASAIALLFTVAPGAPGAAQARTTVYLRWGVSFPVADEVDALPAARARRHLRAALNTARFDLEPCFTLEPVGDDPVAAAFHMTPCVDTADTVDTADMAELAYTSWHQASDWLAPVHVQHLMDYLVNQPDSAALQVTLERVASDEARGESRLRLGVLALGAAARVGALRLLARELRGHGSLLCSRRRTAETAPMLRALHARTVNDRARIYHNLSRPAAEPGATIAHAGDITLTSDEAALLLPLPFALFADSER